MGAYPVEYTRIVQIKSESKSNIKTPRLDLWNVMTAQEHFMQKELRKK